MFNTHKITIPTTAHFYTMGTPGDHIEDFWIVCHGYGQLASNLIRKFSGIDDGKTFILAPEGLSKFYWKGVYGDVGASWMTKKDRLDEIEDYTRYISQLYDQYRKLLPEHVRINLLGFSQGTATQCRWIMKRFPAFHHLILWAGLIPEDLDYRPFKKYFQSKSLYFVYGDNDEYVTQERLDWQTNFAMEQGLQYSVHCFKGKHEINRPLLKSIAEEIKSKPL